MNQIPNFSTINLDSTNQSTSDLDHWKRDLVAQTGTSAEDLTWHTPEGIDIKCLYTAADLSGDMTHLDSFPGFAPF